MREETDRSGTTRRCGHPQRYLLPIKAIPLTRILHSLLLLAGAAYPPPSAHGAHKALVIGVSYTDENYSSLNPTPTLDADAIQSSLTAAGFQPVTKVDPRKTTLLDLNGAIREFKNGLQWEDVAWLYFSGHGCLAPNGENCLVCRDGKLLPLNNVISSLAPEYSSQQGASQVVFVLDSCRSLYGGSPHRAGFALDPMLKALPQGVFVAFAASPMQQAIAREKSETSLYTNHLAFELRQRHCSIYDLFASIRSAVIREEANRQPQDGSPKQMPVEYTTLLFRDTMLPSSCNSKGAKENVISRIFEKKPELPQRLFGVNDTPVFSLDTDGQNVFACHDRGLSLFSLECFSFGASRAVHTPALAPKQSTDVFAARTSSDDRYFAAFLDSVPDDKNPRPGLFALRTFDQLGGDWGTELRPKRRGGCLAVSGNSRFVAIGGGYQDKGGIQIWEILNQKPAWAPQILTDLGTTNRVISHDQDPLQEPLPSDFGVTINPVDFVAFDPLSSFVAVSPAVASHEGQKRKGVALMSMDTKRAAAFLDTQESPVGLAFGYNRSSMRTYLYCLQKSGDFSVFEYGRTDALKLNDYDITVYRLPVSIPQNWDITIYLKEDSNGTRVAHISTRLGGYAFYLDPTFFPEALSSVEALLENLGPRKFLVDREEVKEEFRVSSEGLREGVINCVIDGLVNLFPEDSKTWNSWRSPTLFANAQIKVERLRLRPTEVSLMREQAVTSKTSAMQKGLVQVFGFSNAERFESHKIRIFDKNGLLREDWSFSRNPVSDKVQPMQNPPKFPSSSLQHDSKVIESAITALGNRLGSLIDWREGPVQIVGATPGPARQSLVAPVVLATGFVPPSPDGLRAFRVTLPSNVCRGAVSTVGATQSGNWVGVGDWLGGLFAMRYLEDDNDARKLVLLAGGSTTSGPVTPEGSKDLIDTTSRFFEISRQEALSLLSEYCVVCGEAVVAVVDSEGLCDWMDRYGASLVIKGGEGLAPDLVRVRNYLKQCSPPADAVRSLCFDRDHKGLFWGKQDGSVSVLKLPD